MQQAYVRSRRHIYTDIVEIEQYLATFRYILNTLYSYLSMHIAKLKCTLYCARSSQYIRVLLCKAQLKYTQVYSIIRMLVVH